MNNNAPVNVLAILALVASTLAIPSSLLGIVGLFCSAVAIGLAVLGFRYARRNGGIGRVMATVATGITCLALLVAVPMTWLQYALVVGTWGLVKNTIEYQASLDELANQAGYGSYGEWKSAAPREAEEASQRFADKRAQE